TQRTEHDKEKALQEKSLQSLIFTQSGRRDLSGNVASAGADSGVARRPQRRRRIQSSAIRDTEAWSIGMVGCDRDSRNSTVSLLCVIADPSRQGKQVGVLGLRALSFVF